MAADAKSRASSKKAPQNPPQVEKQTITHPIDICLCHSTSMTDEFIKKSGKPMKFISWVHLYML